MNTPTDLTIPGLRAAGYRVNVRHYRPLREEYRLLLRADDMITMVFERYLPMSAIRQLKLTRFVSATGGTTEVVIVSWDATRLGGVACCSERDAFCYRDGTRIAIEKAFGVHSSKADRAAAAIRKYLEEQRRRNRSRIVREAYQAMKKQENQKP